MKLFKNIKIATLGLAGALTMTSCLSDLDQAPVDPDSFTEIDVFADANSAKGALAKLYAALAITGQQGPSGQGDIQGIDEGSSQFSRMLYNLNELTTDHAVVAWGDPGLPNLHAMDWTSSNQWVEGMYYRLAQEVSFTNSFISNAAALSSDAEVAAYIAEARFLRAYAYYNLLDLFGEVPLLTELKAEKPSQASKDEIFNFIEAELIAIESDLKVTGSNEYGRVDETAAQALLSRLYLNAESFIGVDKYTECVTYSNKVFNSAYSLHVNDANGNGSSYDDLFLADNDANGAANEMIFPLLFDGIQTQTYGGMTFLVHASVGGSMNPVDFGINGGWFGLRSTKALVEKFNPSASNSNGEPIAWGDNRALFYTDGQAFEIDKISEFSGGYTITKFKNVTSQGEAGSDPNGDFPDSDLPLIRVAEIYLNYAEAVLRGGAGGSESQALDYVNQLRTRAFGNNSGSIDAAELSLQFVLDERSRELYWEGFRRTDLIRYGQYTTGSYLWPFKGDVSTGTAVESYRSVFPIPANVIAVNPNLVQNEGY
jgi:hypothetical protein